MNGYNDLTVGVLALQGDFERHLYHLKLLGAGSREVRRPGDLELLDALIIPGGESTTMSQLIDRFGMRENILDFCKSKAVLGTCAGMIMLSTEVINESRVQPLGIIDISVFRNSYGRQVHSFFTDIKAGLNGNAVTLKASFIRAPKVARVGKGVEVLAEYERDPVLLFKDNCLVSSFHTELEEDFTLTRYFVDHYVLKRKYERDKEPER